MAAWLRDGQVDFGRLDEEMQRQVLTRLARDPGARAGIIPQTLVTEQIGQDRIEANRRILEREYSLEGYRRRLERMYQSIAASGVSELDHLDGEALLDRFLAPERLTLLRVD